MLTSAACPFESHISIFYKLMRETYSNRTRSLKKFDAPLAAHFIPSIAPTWLVMNCETPSSHLPTTFCPSNEVENPRKKIKYCRKCMAVGYHSVFFLLSNVHWCLIHQCKLTIMCPSCRDLFLGKVSIDTYFDCPKEVGRLDVHCSVCGISWPNVHCDAPDSWSIRHNIPLESERLLQYQSEWYRRIMLGYAQSSELSKSYFAGRLDHYEIAALESRYHMTSPERIVGVTQTTSMIHWLRLDRLSPLPQITTDEYYYMKGVVAGICDEIKKKYVMNHNDCCAKINKLTCYNPDEGAGAPFCLVGLTYVLFRLKLASEVWPTPASVAAEESDFDFLFKYVNRTMDVATLRKVLTFIFLKMMSDIDKKISGGNTFRILLRRIPIDKDFFWMRRTAYTSRVACKYDCGMDAVRRITACASGARLIIEWWNHRDSADGWLIL
jgi:hypothetical protein